jgi:hypothetical protein
MPPMIEAMAETVGLEDAMRLCWRVGGTRVYVPRPDSLARLPRTHWLIACLGRAAAAAFAEAFGGGPINVPRGPNILYVHALAAQGESTRAIAAQLRISERSVWRHRARLRELDLPPIDVTPQAKLAARVAVLLGLSPAEVERHAGSPP